jgi:DNA-binding NarL/FixJ family response regulator
MKPVAAAAVRVVLADDHDLVRSGIRGLLSLIEGVEVVAEARDGNELVAHALRLAPDVVMTDISMPGMDGIAAITAIHAALPRVRLVVLSMHTGIEFVRRAVLAGACGYLMKDAAAFELEQAVRNIMANGTYFPVGIAQQLLLPPEHSLEHGLTARQLEVLHLIGAGRATKEIAFELGLSPKTVNVHRARIMEHLQLRDAAKLTLYAARRGLVTP